MITEDDARKTRCCGPEGCGTKQRLAGDTQDWQRYCIASQCMGWEWGDEDDFQDAFSAASAAGVSLPKATGDCGLKRGKP